MSRNALRQPSLNPQQHADRQTPKECDQFQRHESGKPSRQHNHYSQTHDRVPELLDRVRHSAEVRRTPVSVSSVPEPVKPLSRRNHQTFERRLCRERDPFQRVIHRSRHLVPRLSCDDGRDLQFSHSTDRVRHDESRWLPSTKDCDRFLRVKTARCGLSNVATRPSPCGFESPDSRPISLNAFSLFRWDRAARKRHEEPYPRGTLECLRPKNTDRGYAACSTRKTDCVRDRTCLGEQLAMVEKPKCSIGSKR